MKQVEDLFFSEAGFGFRRDGGANDGGLAPDGGGACRACLSPFEFVVVGADCEWALYRGKWSSLLRNWAQCFSHFRLLLRHCGNRESTDSRERERENLKVVFRKRVFSLLHSSPRLKFGGWDKLEGYFGNLNI